MKPNLPFRARFYHFRKRLLALLDLGNAADFLFGALTRWRVRRATAREKRRETERSRKWQDLPPVTAMPGCKPKHLDPPGTARTPGPRPAPPPPDTRDK